MAPNRFQRFYNHAMLHLRASRPTWTAGERRNTIFTIYHSEPTVREHYNSHVTEMPNLAALVPNVPWTHADVVETRSHGERPVARIPHHSQPHNGGDTAAIRATVNTVVARLTAPRPPVAAGAPAAAGAPVATDANIGGNDAGNDSGDNDGNNGGDNSQSQDISPYGHWPPLPRSGDPDVLDVDILNGTASEDYIQSFLDGESLIPEEDGNWQGAKFLAAGSYGAVGLWCKIDGNGNVIDRMVVKDNAAVSRRAWRDPKNWRDRLPREIAVGRRIESRRAEEPEACQYINRQRGYRLLMSKRRFRLYADFASGGDLYTAVIPYHQRWQTVEGERVDSEEHIPEAFIWYIIKALATAILLLQQGTTQGDEAVVDWKPIMHLDMQPANILIDLQAKKRKSPDDEATEQAIAGPSKRQKSGEEREVVPQLADFGFSFFDLDFGNNPELDENPHDHILQPDIENGRTRYAPEHNNADTDGTRLDAKTNVWGIGRIAWNLIVNQFEFHGPEREDGAVDSDTDGPLPVSKEQVDNVTMVNFRGSILLGSDRWPAARRYSQELKDLVADCLIFFQEGRPTPRQVLDAVNEHLEANPHLQDVMADSAGTLLSFTDCDGFEIGQRLVRDVPTLE